MPKYKPREIGNWCRVRFTVLIAVIVLGYTVHFLSHTRTQSIAIRELTKTSNVRYQVTTQQPLVRPDGVSDVVSALNENAAQKIPDETVDIPNNKFSAAGWKRTSDSSNIASARIDTINVNMDPALKDDVSGTVGFKSDTAATENITMKVKNTKQKGREEDQEAQSRSEDKIHYNATESQSSFSAVLGSLVLLTQMDVQEKKIKALILTFPTSNITKIGRTGESENELNIVGGGETLRRDIYTSKSEYASTRDLGDLVKRAVASVETSELKIDDRRLETCKEVVWKIVARDKAGNLATDGGESFFVELRGPAIITPIISYSGHGIYEVKFTAFMAGKYKLKVRHDFSRYSGTEEGCDPHNVPGLFLEMKNRPFDTIMIDSSSNQEQCQLGKIKSQTRGEWRICRKGRNPTTTALSWEKRWNRHITLAAELGWVEFKEGKLDSYALQKANVKMQARCGWEEEKPNRANWVYTPYHYDKYWFYPLAALHNKWIHYLGDSLDQGFLTDILVESLSRMIHEDVVASSHKISGWDWSDRHPLYVYHFRKMNFTITFQKLTLPRLDGFHMWNDPPKYAGTGWPGEEGIHDMWKGFRNVLPGNNLYRPSVAVFHYGFHSISRGASMPMYELIVRKLVHWWKHDPVHGNIPLVWRGSTVTHFNERTDYIHQKHRCLTRYRLLEMNSIAQRIMSEYEVPILDMWSVTEGRPSASPDRRHYSDRSDCYGTKVQRTMMSVFLSGVVDILPRRSGQ
eukprot:CFRG2287T1